ncbi:DUF2058 domain-containing protein [Arenimonas oryziterrae]|uniref:Nucleoprotein/polynucleotide-associated enzyme n=1 Tax=Arenimonas oryziterrae DSM 21050 = YC6267 TaxID=1121015 RepID=A0A091BJZ5_9GAMM|nr:DUF2058 family protein [Arenimonas oryziterrae]KFN44650.1 hypothetical protein N789_01170 [Arenimonas oryziterrae DSM 21050 = YC6267]
MSDSLKNQLLGLGFKPAPAPERKPETRDPRSAPGKPGDARRAEHRGGDRKPGDRPRHEAGKPRSEAGKPRHDAAKPRTGPRPDQRRQAHAAGAPKRSQEEIDLGKAYAIRAQKEKDERIEAERVKQEEARVRREAKAKLAELLKDKALNVKDAEIARHFEYGGKIKRVYVTPEQLKALNAGELGVVQDGGRYLVVPIALLIEAEAVFAPCVALKVDPNAPATDDPYSDPAYQVPDDLVW